MAKNGARVKATLSDYWTMDTRAFMFNPPSFGDTKGIDIGIIRPPMGGERLVYQGTKPQVLNGLELYYEGDPVEVRSLIIWLQDYIGYNYGLIFSWGEWYVKRIFLEDLVTEYTLFDEELRPIECKVTLTVRIHQTGMPAWQSVGGI